MFNGGGRLPGPGDIQPFFAHATGRLHSGTESRGRAGTDGLAAQKRTQDRGTKRDHGFHFFGFGLLLFTLDCLLGAHQPILKGVKFGTVFAAQLFDFQIALFAGGLSHP